MLWKKNETFDENKKRILLKKLMFEHAGNPTSSFEFVNFLFEVKCPIFVARQWFRHRIGSYQEISRRYISKDIEIFKPEEIKNLEDPIFDTYYDTLCEKIINFYHTLVEKGIRKEVARAILPVGMYTTFYWQVNLRSLINFLMVRLDTHAQREIKEYAKAILRLIEKFCPITVELLKEKLSKEKNDK